MDVLLYNKMSVTSKQKYNIRFVNYTFISVFPCNV